MNEMIACVVEDQVVGRIVEMCDGRIVIEQEVNHRFERKTK